ncbi:outer membrane receptor protein involved in Fe transport [Breoghania corrubedonensis]|uniref:Outer membrane receptor protein involved in Fe transport n=1 Tax=Breoghania corrubedonensis TaxID=665038 RepID=A0A2T5UYH7_9HYPH|nr:TonB-dependent receptor [Breoghania corrubedonensis]PTW56555.1 outer membrane receptor protein involved in Fe transport [Breoghania corrubedonensis]
MKSRACAYLLGSVSFLSISVMMASSPLAQTAGGTGDVIELETIVVSGEKVERSIDKTASSVTVIGSGALEARPGDDSVAKALANIPNVTSFGAVGAAPSIRGQDTQGPNTGAVAFFGGTVPRATINMDGHNLNYFEYVYGTSSIWDVDTIEVFRGPQTTSQGANSVAGAIIVNTKDPTFTTQGAAQVEVGNYNMKRGSAMFNAPINDELAFRLALDHYGRDTFIDYTSPSYAAGATDTDLMRFTGRAKLLWIPDAIPGLEAKLTYQHSQSNNPTQESAFEPYDDLDSTVTNMPTWYQRTNTGIADVTYAFKNTLKLTNQLQYSDSYTKRNIEPVTSGKAIIEETNISNETRLNFGDAFTRVSGVAGVYYAHTDSDETLNYAGFSAFDDTKDNLGLFAEVDFKLTDRWTITGGLRYERDRVQRVGTSSFTTTDLDYDETFDAWLPKVSVAYALTPDVTVGALVSRGANPGGVALDLYQRRWMDFEQETVWNYELFTRAHFLNDRLFVSGNVFFMDYTDAQRYVTTSLVSGVTQILTVNAESAYSYGAEVTMSYQLLDNVRVNASAGLLKTKIEEFSLLPDYEGNDFSKAPGYMLGAGVEWNITPELLLAVDVKHVDGYYSDDANTPAYQVDPYTVANSRLSYQMNDHLKLYGYVNNIFDEREPTYLQANRSVGGTEGYMLSPRMFGVGMKATF